MQLSERNEKWDLIPLPKGSKPVACKWIFKKEGILGLEPCTFKSRLVVNGFSQEEGIYYYEVFSPFMKHKTILVLMAMVNVLHLDLEQLDVKTTFPNGNIKHKIYMSQPIRFSRFVEGSGMIVEEIHIWFNAFPKEMIHEV